MKRLLSMMMALGLCAVSLSMVSLVHADEFSVVMDEVPDDVSVEVQLDEYEQEVLAEGDEDSVLDDAENIVDDILNDDGSVDEEAIENLLDELESQVDVLLQDGVDGDEILENGVLDQYFQQSDLVNGQRRYLSQKLKDRLRNLAKWHRKILAKFKNQKDEIKQERKDAQKKIRTAKGTLRTLLRQGDQLDREQFMKAKERLKNQAEDADGERKDEAKKALTERVKMMRMKCAADKEMCKETLKEKRENRQERKANVMDKLEDRCTNSDDPAACGARLDEMKMKQQERNEKLKQRASDLRDACADDKESDACREKKQEIKDTIRDQMKDRKDEAGGSGVINRIFSR